MTATQRCRCYRLHWVTWVWLLVFGSILGRIQMHTGYTITIHPMEGGGSVDASGWPLIYKQSVRSTMGAPSAKEFYTHSHVMINALAWLAMVISTAVLLERFIRSRFQTSLATLFAIMTVFAVVFSLRSISSLLRPLSPSSTPCYILAPLSEHWPISIPIMIGFGGATYVVGWLAIRGERFVAGLIRGRLKSKQAEIR